MIASATDSLPEKPKGGWFTVPQLCEHFKKSGWTMLRSLKSDPRTTLWPIPGIRGYRVQGAEARRFGALRWPAVPRLPLVD